MVLAASLISLAPARAIDRDRGWTHLYNNGYPDRTSVPDCQPHVGGENCGSWSDNFGYAYATISFAWNSQTLQNISGTVVEATVRMVNSVPCDHCPWMRHGAFTNHRGVWYTNGDLPDHVCGVQNHYGDPWLTPINHGCCQQSTFWGSDVHIDIRSAKAGCNKLATLMHETGHVVGLGHTVDGSQMMFPALTGRVSRNFGDTNGQFCIYQMQACGLVEG